MKTSFISLLFAFLCFYTFAQAPEGFNYQGIARDSKGKELTNKNISFQLSILMTSATGTNVYTETQSITTNAYGLFTLKVGTGKLISGNFRKINWATGLYFLKVEMDPDGGAAYTFLGTSQLISVPYAMMSNVAIKSLNDLDTSAINELQILKLSNDTLYLDRGGFVCLGNYNDKNAIQQIKSKLNADSTYFDTKINNETTKRQNNDNNLSQKIISDSNYLKGLINTNTTSINNETTARISGDQNLKTKQVSDSNYLRTMVNTTNTNLTTETNSRIAGDNTLKSKHASDSTYLKGLITIETTNRTNSYITLQTNINNLRAKEANDSSLFATYLTTTINSLTTETNSRIAGDNNLKSKVLSDSSYLKGLITTEITNRSNADNTLQSNITTETNFRITGDNNLKIKVVADSSYLKGLINNKQATLIAGAGITINSSNVIKATDTSVTNELQTISRRNDTIFLSNGGFVKLPPGNNTGNIQYWNGSNWVMLTVGQPGQFLQLSKSQIPAWTGCTYPSVTTTAASSIRGLTSTSGGNVTNDGGGTITARGVCWSTSANPTIANSKTKDSTGVGAFTSSITGLTPLTKYHIRAYTTNSAGTEYGNDDSFTTTILTIGESFQGGIIAYILQSGDLGYNSNIQHGLIAAPNNQSSTINWCNVGYTTTGASATALGTGNANTNTIVTSLGTGTYAAKLCYDLVLSGYSDWYLPSKDELNKLYLNKSVIGSFANDYYWSSSEANNDYAYRQNFSNGVQDVNYKCNGAYVRAIRSF